MLNIFKSVWMNAPEKVAPKKNPSFSATKFRNYFMGDTVLDYLNVYGEKLGFQKDDKNENFYQEYVMERGQQFERYVIQYLFPKLKKMTFVNIGHHHPNGFEFVSRICISSLLITHWPQWWLACQEWQ